jgi:hypothetical protein
VHSNAAKLVLEVQFKVFMFSRVPKESASGDFRISEYYAPMNPISRGIGCAPEPANVCEDVWSAILTNGQTVSPRPFSRPNRRVLIRQTVAEDQTQFRVVQAAI